MDSTISRRNFLAVAAAASAVGAAGAMGPGHASAEAIKGDGGMDPQVLHDWLDDRHNYSCATSALAFLPGEENAPTDDELKWMLKVANSYMWCHLLTAPHFVVVRDPEEQQAIVGSMGVTGDGTVTILVLADGCKDQEHHQARYSASRTEPVHYWEMYYAITEAGQAHAYLNLAARSLGYRIRNYAALDVPNISYQEGLGEQDVVPLWECGGNWDYIRKDNWDIEKYCHSQDGSVDFTHYVLAGDQQIDLDGNLTLLYAIVVGKVDEDALDTSVTDFSPRSAFTDLPVDRTKQFDNYSFWDSGFDALSNHEEPEGYEADYEAAVAEMQADGTAPAQSDADDSESADA